MIILTKNEELHIGRAIRSVKSFATQILVVDSGSTDNTVPIAIAEGATVLSNSWINYSTQFKWALDNAPIDADWIMRLDADEIIQPDLQIAITATLPGLDASVVGISLNRKHVFMGRFIRHGGRGSLVLLRIWRRGFGQIEDRWMDEHIVVSGGSIINLQGGFVDQNLNGLSFFTEKHNKYASREAVDALNQDFGFSPRELSLTAEGGPTQAVAKRRLKERVYNAVPFQVGAILYFIYRYLFQFGFLDGKEGLVYHVLQGFWYRFLVGAKVLELRRALKGITDPEEMKAELRRMTGLKIN